MTDKLRKSISILTFCWFISFICLSTSHMGNTHNISIPQKSSVSYKFTEYNSEHNQQCPWRFAALKTIGDLSVSDISLETTIDDLYISAVQNQYRFNNHNKLSARAPPVT